MDMIFRDDECRIRTDNAPANFTTLKHMAHNLIRKAPGKDSLRLKRKVAAWDDDFLCKPHRRMIFSPDSPGGRPSCTTHNSLAPCIMIAPPA